MPCEGRKLVYLRGVEQLREIINIQTSSHTPTIEHARDNTYLQGSKYIILKDVHAFGAIDLHRECLDFYTLLLFELAARCQCDNYGLFLNLCQSHSSLISGEIERDAYESS